VSSAVRRKGLTAVQLAHYKDPTFLNGLMAMAEEIVDPKFERLQDEA
jgi:hypothetical protein